LKFISKREFGNEKYISMTHKTTID